MTSVAVEPVGTRAPRRVLHGFRELALAAARPADPEWVTGLRAAGAARFDQVGLPGSKDEEWRFTSLQSLAAHRFAPLGLPSGECIAVSGPAEWPLLVIVDGVVDLSRSALGTLPHGVTVGSLRSAIATGNPLVRQHLARLIPVEATPFAAASAALFQDGAFIHVAAGAACEAPIQVLHLSTRAAESAIISPRSLVVVDRGGNATVMETFVHLGSPPYGSGTPVPYLTNACIEVVVGEGARLEHIRVQRESAAAWHVGFTAVEQARESHYRSFTLDLGGRLSRHNLHARLGAPAVETLLYGLYLGRHEQLVDNHTAIFHDQPDCNSWEVYKGILADKSHGVFNGKVFVAPEAQKTDAKQTNRNLLLSDTARVNTKPQLEIFADDVKCTHGATVGKLSEQQRFYLRTRGIAGREAEAMLLAAFVAEVLVEINQPQVRESLRALVYAEMDALIGR